MNAAYLTENPRHGKGVAGHRGIADGGVVLANRVQNRLEAGEKAATVGRRITGTVLRHHQVVESEWVGPGGQQAQDAARLRSPEVSLGAHDVVEDGARPCAERIGGHEAGHIVGVDIAPADDGDFVADIRVGGDGAVFGLVVESVDIPEADRDVGVDSVEAGRFSEGEILNLWPKPGDLVGNRRHVLGW